MSGVPSKQQLKIRADLAAIGRRIREIRGFEMTQEELGRILGIGQRQLSKYESGQSAPTLDILLRLSIFSRKSIDWILTGNENKED
jgi:transcriptional regulator with XRE-family HTH domain